MLQAIKTVIRKFALWLNARTELWVLPKSFWLVAEMNETAAKNILNEARETWGHDPHITYAETILHFEWKGY